MNDYQLYTRLQAQMSGLLKTEGKNAIDLPEYQAAWRTSEALKNKNGGMPPTEISTAGVGTNEPRPIGEQAGITSSSRQSITPAVLPPTGFGVPGAASQCGEISKEAA